MPALTRSSTASSTAAIATMPTGQAIRFYMHAHEHDQGAQPREGME
jgi:hypothetical protein